MSDQDTVLMLRCAADLIVNGECTPGAALLRAEVQLGYVEDEWSIDNAFTRAFAAEQRFFPRMSAEPGREFRLLEAALLVEEGVLP